MIECKRKEVKEMKKKIISLGLVAVMVLGVTMHLLKGRVAGRGTVLVMAVDIGSCTAKNSGALERDPP
jgi:hypothetical protein